MLNLILFRHETLKWHRTWRILKHLLQCFLHKFQQILLLSEENLSFIRSNVDIHGVFLRDNVETDEGKLVSVVTMIDLVDNLGQLDVVTRTVVDEEELSVRRSSSFSMNRTGDESKELHVRHLAFYTSFLEILFSQFCLNYLLQR